MSQLTPPNPTVRAAVVVGLSLALGLLFNLLFIDIVPGISVLIYFLAIAAGLFAAARLVGQRIPPAARWLLLPAAGFAALVAIRASEPLALLDVGAVTLLLLLIARLTFGASLLGFNLADYIKLPLLPLQFMDPLGRTLGELVALRSTFRRHPLGGQIIRGVALAIPMLLIFLVLFASADLAFQKYLTAAFNFHLSAETYARTIVVAVITLLFTGAYSYIFGGTGRATAAAEPAFPRRLGAVESGVLLGSVNVLFFSFILIQLAYLFGGQHNISSLGFTYAEYARKGFFELLAVALVAFGMLWLSDRAVKKNSGHHTRTFRLLSGTLIIQVLLIMVSAFKRLYLYEQAYGFTTLRLYSHVFVIFLAVIFILLLIKILRDQPESRFAFPAFLTAVIFLAGLNLLNPDAFIARQNLDRFHHTGKLDGRYLGSLSADARTEIEEAIRLTDGTTKQDLVTAAGARVQPADWQSWNLARRR